MANQLKRRIAAWIKGFFAHCIEASRDVAASLESTVHSFILGRRREVQIVSWPCTVRKGDTRARVHATIVLSEGPPDGLVRALTRLQQRIPGRIVDMDVWRS